MQLLFMLTNDLKPEKDQIKRRLTCKTTVVELRQNMRKMDIKEDKNSLRSTIKNDNNLELEKWNDKPKQK